MTKVYLEPQYIDDCYACPASRIGERNNFSNTLICSKKNDKLIAYDVPLWSSKQIIIDIPDWCPLDNIYFCIQCKKPLESYAGTIIHTTEEGGYHQGCWNKLQQRENRLE